MKFVPFSTATALIGLCSASTVDQEYNETMNKIDAITQKMNVFATTENNSQEQHILKKLFLSPILKNIANIEMPVHNEKNVAAASFLFNFINSQGLYEHVLKSVKSDPKTFTSLEKTIEVLSTISNKAFSKTVSKSGFIPVLELSNIYCGLLNEIAKIEKRENDSKAIVSTISEVIQKLAEISNVMVNETIADDKKYSTVKAEISNLLTIIKKADSQAEEFFKNIKPTTSDENKELVINAVNLKYFVKSLKASFGKLSDLVTENATVEKVGEYVETLPNVIKTLVFFSVPKSNIDSMIAELEGNFPRMTEGTFKSMWNGAKNVVKRVPKNNDKFFFNEENKYVDIISNNLESKPAEAEKVEVKNAESKPEIKEVVGPNPNIVETEVIVVTGEITKPESNDNKPENESSDSNGKFKNIIILSIIAFAVGIAGLLYYRYAYKVAEIDN